MQANGKNYSMPGKACDVCPMEDFSLCSYLYHILQKCTHCNFICPLFNMSGYFPYCFCPVYIYQIQDQVSRQTALRPVWRKPDLFDPGPSPNTTKGPGICINPAAQIGNRITSKNTAWYVHGETLYPPLKATECNKFTTFLLKKRICGYKVMLYWARWRKKKDCHTRDKTPCNNDYPGDAWNNKSNGEKRDRQKANIGSQFVLVFKYEVVVFWHFGKALEAMQTMLNRNPWLLSVASND